MPTLTVYVEDQVTSLAKDLDIDPFTVRYCLGRLEKEGMRFLTVTLPKLTKSVLHSLECGRFKRPTDFRWKGRSLVVFTSLLAEIFCPEGYVLNSERAPKALLRLRQFCDYFYKIAFEFSKKELDRAERTYVEIEEQTREYNARASHEWKERLRKSFETNYKSLAKAHVHQILGSFRPRSTPGSVAFSSRVDIPDDLRHLPFWLLKLLPDSQKPTVERSAKDYIGYFRPYPGHRHNITVGHEAPECEVLFVPKDSRGPRVISKEPLNRLRAQMSYFDFVSKTLEEETKQRINFTRQEINQLLAEQGSINKQWATLDLKEASDRVSYMLVKHIFQNAPGLRWFINNVRSTHAVLPSGAKLQLAKLAGMGSGLTFPTMALLIHLSVATLVTQRTGLPYKEVSNSIYVYGDDLIIPRNWYDIAIEALSLSGLCVNTDKSFVRGFFRESCGADHYFGVLVTPTKLRLSSAGLPEPKTLRGLPLKLSDSGILQVERHCRELFKAGLWSTMEMYYKRLEKALGPLPTVSMTSPVLGRVDHSIFATRGDARAYVCSSQEDRFDMYCPYKYLGKVLVSDRDEGSDVFPEALASTYGVVAQPRNVRLKRKLVSNLDMDPVLIEDAPKKRILDSLKGLSRFFSL